MVRDELEGRLRMTEGELLSVSVRWSKIRRRPLGTQLGLRLELGGPHVKVLAKRA